MPSIEMMGTVSSPDPEARVRARVVRFLTSRGYRATNDPAEFKRGSVFGSWTGFTPKKWAVTLRFKPAESESFFYKFVVDTTGQSVTRGEHTFWEREKQALEDTIAGNVVPPMSASENAVASQNARIVKTTVLYSVGGGALAGAGVIALHFAGIDVFPGFAGVGAGLGAALGLKEGVESA